MQLKHSTIFSEFISYIMKLQNYFDTFKGFYVTNLLTSYLSTSLLIYKLIIYINIKYIMK